MRKNTRSARIIYATRQTIAVSILLLATAVFASCGTGETGGIGNLLTRDDGFSSVDVLNYTGVRFTGSNGNGEATVTRFGADFERTLFLAADGADNLLGMMMLSGAFSASVYPSTGLSNGDIVTVTIDVDEEIANSFSIRAEALTKTVVVEGLAIEIRQASDITDESFRRLAEEAKDDLIYMLENHDGKFQFARVNHMRDGTFGAFISRSQALDRNVFEIVEPFTFEEPRLVTSYFMLRHPDVPFPGHPTGNWNTNNAGNASISFVFEVTGRSVIFDRIFNPAAIFDRVYREIESNETFYFVIRRGNLAYIDNEISYNRLIFRQRLSDFFHYCILSLEDYFRSVENFIFEERSIE